MISLIFSLISLAFVLNNRYFDFGNRNPFQRAFQCFINPSRSFLRMITTIVREGLAKLLEGEADLQVVGEAENGREAVERVEALKPDVVLMDIAMPMLNGIEATRQIRKICARNQGHHPLHALSRALHQ